MLILDRKPGQAVFIGQNAKMEIMHTSYAQCTFRLNGAKAVLAQKKHVKITDETTVILIHATQHKAKIGFIAPKHIVILRDNIKCKTPVSQETTGVAS